MGFTGSLFGTNGALSYFEIKTFQYMFDKLTLKLLIDSAKRNVCSLPHSDSGNQNTLDLLHKQIKIMTEHIPSSFSQLRLKIHWFNSGSCPMYSRFHNLMTSLKINSSNNLFECPRVPVVSNFEETIFLFIWSSTIQTLVLETKITRCGFQLNI